MREPRRKRLQGLLARIAAAVLLVQGILLQATAAAPAHAGFDIFGNPLCITGASDTDNGPGGPTPRGLCCLAACSSSPALPPVEFDGVELRPRARPAVAVEQRRAVFVRMPDHNPANPRAPPRTN